MPTPTDIARAVTKVVKAEILSVLQALHTKIQELESKVEVQRLEIETLKNRLTKNESMLPKKQD
jgi:hypothetical protein